MPFVRVNRTRRNYPWLVGTSNQQVGGDYSRYAESSSSESSSSLSSSSSSSSFDCPNNIYSVTATIRNDLIFTFDKYLAVNINGSTESDNYIQLYDADLSGSSYDANRIFYGNTSNTNPKTSNNFVSMIINGTTYYLRKYSGDNNVDCCSNLIGNDASGGIFTLYGFVLVRVNGTESKYVRVYTFEDQSSSSSSSS